VNIRDNVNGNVKVALPYRQEDGLSNWACYVPTQIGRAEKLGRKGGKKRCIGFRWGMDAASNGGVGWAEGRWGYD